MDSSLENSQGSVHHLQSTLQDQHGRMHLIKKLRIKIKNDRSHLKTSQDLISYITEVSFRFSIHQKHWQVAQLSHKIGPCSKSISRPTLGGESKSKSISYRILKEVLVGKVTWHHGVTLCNGTYFSSMLFRRQKVNLTSL